MYQIFKFGNVEEVTRLIQLLFKNMHGNYDVYQQKINSSQKLSIILDWRYEFFKNKSFNDLHVIFEKWGDKKYNSIETFFNYKVEFRDAGQSKSILKYVKKYLIPGSIKYYLDWGTSYGGLALAIANELNIPVNNITGVEVHQSSIEKHLKHFEVKDPLFQYIIIDPKTQNPIKIENESQDLVTSFMVLHHVQNLSFVLNEIQRILKPGGYFLIKEHDCWNAMDAMLIDIEHSIYRLLIDKESTTSFKKPYNNYFRYMNFYAVKWLITQKNFNFIKADFAYSSLQAKISPNRAWWGLFQKPLLNPNSN